ncbi:MAG: putative bifunctional diguanylate cyclase/phosphodiesterase [Actinomycetes bacterium]
MNVRAEARRSLLLMAVVLVATGGVLTWLAHGQAQDPAVHLHFLVLVTLFALAEVAIVHLPLGRETHSVSFAEVPLVLGLVMADPIELVVARVLGSLLVQVVVRRQPPVKLALNTASWTLHAAMAVFLYVVVFGTPSATTAAGWVALVVAAVVADSVAAVTISAAIGLSRGRLRWADLGENFLATGALVASVNAVLGLVGVLLLNQDLRAGVFLVVVVGVMFLVIQGYHQLRLKHARLELLYRFTKTVDRSIGDSSVAQTIVNEARTLLRAQEAAVVVGASGFAVAIAGSTQLAAERWVTPALEGRVLSHPRRRRGEPAPELTGTGHADAMAVPLRGDSGVIGALVVADRLDAVTTFDADDLKLFEALAGHAGVALDNSRLVDQVRAEAAAKEHLALHDQLTGLPNRLAFQRALESVLWSGRPAGVMLLDLDRFKEVNDTLGHDVGDRLLVEVAHRARGLARDDWEVARLGGDELVLLVVGDHVAADLEGLAHDVLRALSLPFRVAGLDVQVRASAGLAVAPEDGDDAVQLLRRAEVAMYDAKSGVSSVSRYSAARDPYNPRRLSLAADLERALHSDALEVHYQPQIELDTGRVVGVEALVRWDHPVHGAVRPDEFVPIAARTGLIRALTHFVLRRALADCSEILHRDPPLTVSVNLSMRNLLEPELAGDVSALLAEAGVAPEALVLEMTESEIMSEPERSTEMLHRLASLGIALSVDDFGTGHSSLLHLRSLPVREVKVDRTFVASARFAAGDAAIVRSVIELGHNLGLRVVAEGVEELADLRVLASWGCNMAQGYYVARPMPAAEAMSWLHAHESVTV